LTDIKPNVFTGQTISDLDDTDHLVFGENRAFGANTKSDVVKLAFGK